jgi:hypothetical protein
MYNQLIRRLFEWFIIFKINCEYEIKYVIFCRILSQLPKDLNTKHKQKIT